MHTVAFDGRMGASGDMICAALIDAGADPAVLGPVSDALNVRYTVGPTARAGVTATTVDVLVAGDGARERAGDHSHDHGDSDHDHDHSHGHDHDDPDHDHDHSHGHDHDDPDHDHTHAEGTGPLRTYPEVVELVEGMELPSGVERDALAAFRHLGEAEASVHGTDLDATHFHEVGADDAVADVVGACLLLDDLGPDRVVTTPVSVGGGRVSMSHGTYPVPAPAVAEIVADADWSIRGGPVERELLTPTGAAIFAAVADGVDHLPGLDADAVGYGAGDADVAGHPNALRVLVGDGGGLHREPIAVLETNLDDATPETLGSLQETLGDAGALDVSVLSATMKKSRPGHLVKVITRPEDAERVARRLAEETGTLGVREGSAGHRWVADRSIETVTVEAGGETHEIQVKVASDAEGSVYDRSAEYDDALAVAAETGLTVREVRRRAEAAIADNG
ncbi:nickel pincer cofactor biosynthesis protein LarC [Haloplanus sp.]|uniref:nickel pincer cofactor biosynthesis protein LarC n=1 Tax=Haloplanus sp. TaxID=1961696 RepID=UPI0026377C2E|nr:nickel pincer cofactor biosynthesis protein LarC [Haloplanus sp.]